MKYLNDVYLNILSRIGCACLPLLVILNGRSVAGSWVSLTILVSCFTIAVLRFVSIRWFDKPVCLRSNLRAVTDSLLGYPYSALIIAVVYQQFITPGADLTSEYCIIIFLSLAMVAPLIISAITGKKIEMN